MHDWHWLQADNWKLISFSFKWAPQVYLTFQNKVFSAIFFLYIMMVWNFALFLSFSEKTWPMNCLYRIVWILMVKQLFKKEKLKLYFRLIDISELLCCITFMSQYSILRISRSHFKLILSQKYKTFCKTLADWEKCHCSH